MSTEIDQRIVEMRFDNKQFEANTKTTISTLDKLKQSLNLTGAAKGLENVNAAAKNCDMSGLSSAVETVKLKFSALEIMAVTALANITNSAFNAGKRITSALTIDPIKTGFQEYETQINAIQTILANTSSKGTTLQQVNAALDELNTYADKTIYNFTEMTRNIGTFTAAGVGLNTSVKAIKGIANLAAVSGSNSQQASTAMYQLSQALASGTVKLMDWNSVVNAGMGGQVFQDALKETARVHGVAIDKMIKDEGSFRETLSSGWLSADILTETLAKFTGDLSEAQLRQQGYTQDQISEIMKLGEMANDAATKVKTFTQLFDTLKESAQSGWTQSWQIIIGDFEEAKELFTKVSDTIGRIIGDSADARNNLLSGGLSTGWDQFLRQGISDEEGYKDAIQEVSKKHNIALDEMIKKEGSFEATLKSGWLTSDIMSESLERLTSKTRGLSDEQLVAQGYTREQITALETLNESVQNGSVSVEDFAKKMTMVSGRENIIEALSNSFEGLVSVLTPIKQAFREIFPSYTGGQLYALTETIRDLTAKFKLSETTSANLKSTFKGLFAILDIGKQAFLAITNAIKPSFGVLFQAVSGVLGVTGSIGEFVYGIDEAIKKSNTFEEVFKKVGSVFEPIVRGITTFVSDVAALLLSFGTMDTSGLDSLTERIHARFEPLTKIATTIGNAFGNLKEHVANALSNVDFDTVFDVINGGLFVGILAGLKKIIDSFSEITENIGSFGGLKDILDGVKGSLEAYQSQLKANVLLKIAIAMGLLAASLVALSLIDSKKLTSSLAAMTVMFVELFGSMAVFEKIMGSAGFVSMGKVTLAMVGLSTAILILSHAMRNLAELDWNGIAKGLTAVAGLSAILVLSSNQLSKSSGKLMRGAASLVIFAAAIKILADVVKSLSVLSWEEMIKGLVGVGVLVTELTLFMKVTDLDGMGIRKGIGLMALAGAISILAIAVKTFSSLDIGSLIKGLGSVAIVLTELSVFVKTTGNSKNVITTAIGLTILGAAMLIFSKAVSNMGSMSWEQIGKGLLTMAGALAIVAVAMKAMPKSMVLTGAGLVVVATALVVLSNAIQNMGGLSWEQIAKGLATLAGSLTIIAVAMAFMTTALPGAAALMVVSGALSLLTPTLLILGSMSLGAIATSLIALAGAFAVIGVAGAVLAPLTPAILAFSVAILAVGVGMLAFSAALTALSVSGIAGATALSVVFTTLLGLIVPFAKKIGESIVEFAKTIGKGAVTIAKAVGSILLAIINEITKTVPTVVKSIFTFVSEMLKAFVEFIPQLVSTGITLITSVLEGIASSIGKIVSIGVEIAVKFIEGVASKLPDIIQAGFDLIIAFINGLADAIEKNSETLVTAMMNLAGAMVEGLIKGLIAGVKDVANSAVELGKSALDAVATYLDINSPSRKFKQLGIYTGEGFIVGLKSVKNVLSKVTTNVFRKAVFEPVNENVEKTARSMSYGGDAFKVFAYEYRDMSSEFKDTSAIESASKAITAYGKKIYEESEQYKIDTKSLKEHKGELESLQVEYSKLQKELVKTNNANQKTEEIQSELKKVEKSIGDTKKQIIQDENSIVEHTQEAFNQLKDSISSSVKSSIDPLKLSLDTQINLFEKFDSDTEVVVSEILENMQSQVIGVKNWNANLEELASRGFAKGLIDQLKDMGPSGSNYVKAFMNMTTDEMEKANLAFNESSELTAQTLIDNFDDSLEAAKLWAENMQTLAKSGLNQDVLEALGNMGMDGEEYIKAFMTMSSDQITEFNKQYEECLTLPDSVSDKVIASFVAAGSTASKKFADEIKAVTSPNSEENQTIAANSTTMGSDTTNNVSEGMQSNEAILKNTSTGLGQVIFDGFNTYLSVPKGKSLGGYICDGIVQGLEEGNSAVTKAAKRVAREAYEAAKDELDINSPSKAFAELGMFADKGLVVGLRSFAGLVSSEARNVGKTAISALASAISNVSAIVNGEVDMSPVIRPVLDLTNIESGKKEIGSMLDGSRGISLSDTTSKVSSIVKSFQTSGSGGSQNIIQPKQGASFTFEQNIYSPTPLSRLDIYRQTKNQFSAMKGLVDGI